MIQWDYEQLKKRVAIMFTCTECQKIVDKLPWMLGESPICEECAATHLRESLRPIPYIKTLNGVPVQHD